MTIACHLSRFYLFALLEHDMDFGQVQVMKFPWHLPKENEEISIGFGVIFNQTTVKRHEKIPVTFLQRARLYIYRRTEKGV